MRVPITLTAAALALALAGCTGPETTVAVDAETATVAAGDTLRVEIGTVNSSVGDSWYLVSGADTGVLSDAGRHADGEENCDGCSEELSWDFEALEPGETTLVFQYCFRTGLENCAGGDGHEPAPDPVELTVTVTE